MPRLDPATYEQIVAVSHQARREAKLAGVPQEVPQSVRESLAAMGIENLYSHQEMTYKLAQSGHNVVVTTASASGKSLCFNLPVLSALAGSGKPRALYIYPTKALTQDQVRKLQALKLPFVRPGVYDGDTPPDQRREIRRRANILLTNSDMLHMGILPNHGGWQDFLFNLRFVVIDEAHSYRGVFGSHVSNVLRRLRRICSIYGSRPVFILTTATIANPDELASSLTGLDFELVATDGSPRGERQIVFWNPPLIDKALGTRKSVFAEAALLFADLISRGTRTIVFARTRKGTELIFRYTTQRLEQIAPQLSDAVSPYRGGYTPAQRRRIEKGLFEGDLLGVVSTSALELGIDVGGIDAVISATYPGTVASLWQQWGRAGRGAKESLAVYMAGQDALDQFFALHPDELLERDVESAILDHKNRQIFTGHLGAAAFESPLEQTDEEFFEPGIWDAAQALLNKGMLRKRKDHYFWALPEYPAQAVSLRSSSLDSFSIIVEDTGAVLGEVEAERAFVFVHPGAIYMHLGETYQVRHLDIDGRVALVRPTLADYYTQPKKETSVEILEPEMARTAAGAELSWGRLVATEQVVAFQKKQLSDNQVLEIVKLDLPEQSFLTEGFWFPLSEELLADLEPPDLLGSLHATEHGLIAMLPLYAMCDRWDIGGLSIDYHWQTEAPSIFVYDGHPGGIGISRQGFGSFEELVSASHKLISSCPCEAGCPSCVQSPKCGNLNEPLSKWGAINILGKMKKMSS